MKSTASAWSAFLLTQLLIFGACRDNHFDSEPHQAESALYNVEIAKLTTKEVNQTQNKKEFQLQLELLLIDVFFDEKLPWQNFDYKIFNTAGKLLAEGAETTTEESILSLSFSFELETFELPDAQTFQIELNNNDFGHENFVISIQHQETGWQIKNFANKTIEFHSVEQRQFQLDSYRADILDRETNTSLSVILRFSIQGYIKDSNSEAFLSNQKIKLSWDDDSLESANKTSKEIVTETNSQGFFQEEFQISVPRYSLQPMLAFSVKVEVIHTRYDEGRLMGHSLKAEKIHTASELTTYQLDLSTERELWKEAVEEVPHLDLGLSVDLIEMWDEKPHILEDFELGYERTYLLGFQLHIFRSEGPDSTPIALSKLDIDLKMWPGLKAQNKKQWPNLTAKPVHVKSSSDHQGRLELEESFLFPKMRREYQRQGLLIQLRIPKLPHIPRQLFWLDLESEHLQEVDFEMLRKLLRESNNVQTNRKDNIYFSHQKRSREPNYLFEMAQWNSLKFRSISPQFFKEISKKISPKRLHNRTNDFHKLILKRAYFVQSIDKQELLSQRRVPLSELTSSSPQEQITVNLYDFHLKLQALQCLQWLWKGERTFNKTYCSDQQISISHDTNLWTLEDPSVSYSQPEKKQLNRLIVDKNHLVQVDF